MDIPESTVERARELVRKSRYASPNEFFKTAAGRQIRLDEGDRWKDALQFGGPIGEEMIKAEVAIVKQERAPIKAEVTIVEQEEGNIRWVG